MDSERDSADVTESRTNEAPVDAQRADALTPDERRDLISKAEGRLRVWFSLYRWSNRAYWFFGILGVISSALAASEFFHQVNVGARQVDMRGVFALISTLCWAILGFIDPQRRGARLIRGWRLLDAELDDFRYGRRSARRLLDAMATAESILGQGLPDEDQPGRQPAMGGTPATQHQTAQAPKQ